MSLIPVVQIHLSLFFLLAKPALAGGGPAPTLYSLTKGGLGCKFYPGTSPRKGLFATVCKVNKIANFPNENLMTAQKNVTFPLLGMLGELPLDILGHLLSPLVISFMLGIIWILYPFTHIFYFLLFFELVFLLTAIEMVVAWAFFGYTVSSLGFALVLCTLAALESLTVLSFLNYYGRTGRVPYFMSLRH